MAQLHLAAVAQFLLSAAAARSAQVVRCWCVPGDEQQRRCERRDQRRDRCVRGRRQRRDHAGHGSAMTRPKGDVNLLVGSGDTENGGAVA